MQIRLNSKQNLHIQSSSDLFHLLQPAFLRSPKLDCDREHLWLLCLDHSQTPGSQSVAGSRTLELLGHGTQNNVLIDPMEVYHRALLRRAAFHRRRAQPSLRQLKAVPVRYHRHRKTRGCQSLSKHQTARSPDHFPRVCARGRL